MRDSNSHSTHIPVDAVRRWCKALLAVTDADAIVVATESLPAVVVRTEAGQLAEPQDDTAFAAAVGSTESSEVEGWTSRGLVPLVSALGAGVGSLMLFDLGGGKLAVIDPDAMAPVLNGLAECLAESGTAAHEHVSVEIDFDRVQHPVFVFDAGWTIQHSNRAGHELLESLERRSSDNNTDMVIRWIGHQTRDDWRRTLRRRTPESVERIVASTNAWYRLNPIPSVGGVMLHCIPIEAQAEAKPAEALAPVPDANSPEAQLSRMHTWTDAVWSGTEMPWIVMKPDGEFLTANSAARFLGEHAGRNSEHAASTLWHYLDDGDVHRLRRGFSAALASPGRTAWTSVFPMEDDYAFDAAVQAVEIDDSGALAISMALCPASRFEERASRIRAQQERLRALLDTAKAQIYMLGESGEVQYLNRAAAEFNRLADPAEALDTPLWKLPDWARIDRGATFLTESIAAAAQGQARRFQDRVPASGTAGAAVLDVVVTPLLIGGMPTGCILVEARDVTRMAADSNRRWRDEDHRETTAKAENVMETVGRLAGGIALDFNNALTAIQGYADLLVSSMSAQDPAVNDVHAIRNATTQARDLTATLLTIAQKSAIAPERFDFGHVVEGTLDRIRAVVGPTVDVFSTIASQAGHVYADPSRIEQLILHVAGYARDAMRDGGTLTLDVAPEGADSVLLTIADSSPGMPQEESDHLFEPFFRPGSAVANRRRRSSDSGLAMAAVYGIVRQANGTIEVESQPGKGTRFHIRFPRVSDQVAATVLGSEGANDDVLRPLAVVVDDDALLRDLVRRFLVDLHFDVLCAGSAAEALSAVDTTPRVPELLVADIFLPGSSGTELALEMREKIPGIPVLHISGYAQSELVRRGGMDGCEHLLAKPFSAADFAAAVARVTEPTSEHASQSA